MERAAVIGGVFLAIIVILVANIEKRVAVSFGDEDWGGFQRAAYVEPSPGRMAETTYAETSVRVRNAAAIVRVVSEERSDIAVSIENPGRAPMPLVEQRGGQVIIDGRLARRIDDCRNDGGVKLEGYGVLSRQELPVIAIRAPRDLEIKLGGAVHGEIGAAQAADISVSGCGTTRIGDMADRLEISNDGSGTVTAGAARSAEVSLAGSGEVSIGAVAESLEASVAGSGEVEAASLRGRLEVNTAGSGDVFVRGGAVSEAKTDIAGSGSVTVSAPVQRLEVSIAGSGDVTVEGQVGDVEASIMGSGDVVVGGITGNRSQSVMGSGGVVVRAPVSP